MAKKSLKTFTWQYGVKFVAVVASLAGTAIYAAERYVIGLDTQDTRCLDEWVYIIDTWVKPTASDVQVDDYVAIVLNESQTPQTAKWRFGQVMVKRAMATAGDDVEVTLDGVKFSDETASWEHGTGLQAAPLLGQNPDSYLAHYKLADDQLFMMGDNPISYDGRYYGPIKENQIVGAVVWAF